MRRWKRRAWAIALIGTSVIPACSTLTLTSLRDAAIAGTSDFVQISVFELLESLLDISEST